MDPAALLQPRGDDAVSGENLEYDADFIDLELAAQPGEETQLGDEVTAAEEPDYSDVVSKAEAVLERSHDVRAAVFYANAVLHTKGLPGFADATEYIRGCLEQHWATCHPELDEDDDDDPTMRINAVQGLAGSDTVLRSLRRCALTDSRMFGRLSLRHIEVAEGVIPVPADMTDIPDSSGVAAAFQDTDPEHLSGLLDAAKAAKEHVAAVDAVFAENTPGQGPDLDPLSKSLSQIVKRLADSVGGEDAGSDESDETSEVEVGAATGGGASSPAAGGGTGAINSPTDVSNALDRIISYYNRSEPSSPVPLLLERAKRLVNADFLTIMNDMAPRGLENVNIIGGIDDDDD